LKYVCKECGKLMEEAEVFAKDGEGYYCSLDCYHETWEEPYDEEETQEETIEEKKPVSYVPTLDYNGQPKKRSLFGFGKEI